MPTANRRAYQYARTHHGVRDRWGKASEHLCIDCMGPAAQWAKIQLYSRNSTFYRPMCLPCHTRLDKTGVKRAPYQRRMVTVGYS